MVDVHCIHCAQLIKLPIAYTSYQGYILCPHCSKYQSLKTESGKVTNQKAIFRQPTASENLVEIPDAPANIVNDFKEAQICHNVSAYKGSVVLCRRTLELLCMDKGAPDGDRLFDKIRFLFDNGFISQKQLEYYTEIRLFGNYGAHPSNDLLGDVSDGDSEIVLEVIEHILRDTYEISTKTETLRQRRTQPN